ncbi:MAG: Rpn family recombination-promoting nuclease/putative transposase, partial [Lachnospiraceae bacterium]|nr:Rpn family recombination-promoting nuclease/putative transposase [Lachnospiraceae bacterium]
MYADTNNNPLIGNGNAENGARTCLPVPLPDTNTDGITSLSCSPGCPADTNGLLPVTNDIVFKAIFGQEDSKPILRSFLNAFLKLDIQNPEQIELLNTEINPELIADKKCVLDIKVRLPDKTSIDIEIQVVNQYNMDKRS